MAFSPPVWQFFISILFGAGLGVIWDICRLLKQKAAHHKGKVTFVLDAVFCAIVCVFTLTFFFIFTSGGFRAFVIIGEFLGFLFYYLTIESFFYFILKNVIDFIFMVFGNILNSQKVVADVLEKPTRFMFNKINYKHKKNRKNSCFSNIFKCIIKKMPKFNRKGKLD